jgi:hypothetical protein
MHRVKTRSDVVARIVAISSCEYRLQNNNLIEFGLDRRLNLLLNQGVLLASH